ncbi:MAG: hypothetical protein WC334_02470 [Kiritimatiellales bacterium]|jgi:hypothetical protein
MLTLKNKRPGAVLFAAILWLSGSGAAAQDADMQGSGRISCIPLGTLAPFWRYSAALGPFLEGGQALIEIPDYVLSGDFPYKKRPYPMEVPFADHLSLVRILGGYNDGSAKGKSDPAVRARDLAWRGADGKIHYRMELLKPRLQPYLDNGCTNLTIVLDNVPWCFPEHPAAEGLGQKCPPRDPQEWHDFVEAVCEEFVHIMGSEAANRLRFRVGTENNGVARFSGSHDEFIRHYDASAAAVKSVLPDAQVGPFNIGGAGVRGNEKANVRPFDLAAHCFNETNTFTGKVGTPFDWVAFSRYYLPGIDLEANARGCGVIWDEFERRVPQLKGVSREIHEFGVAPFGEEEKGHFVSEECGALGAAATAQMMFRLREDGIDRLWHWGVTDRFRARDNKLHSLFTGEAWLLSVLEYAAGGEAFLLEPVAESAAGTRFIGLASVKSDVAIFIFSAYNKDTAVNTSETVRFRIPKEAVDLSKTLSYAVLNRDTAVHDRIRRDFEAAGLLADRFTARPDRLGGVREMGKGRPAEILAGDKLAEYYKVWERSLTLKPLAAGIGTLTELPGYYEFTLNLTPPEVLVIRTSGE